jgi:hypothetical protein
VKRTNYKACHPHFPRFSYKILFLYGRLTHILLRENGLEITSLTKFVATLHNQGSFKRSSFCSKLIYSGISCAALLSNARQALQGRAQTDRTSTPLNYSRYFLLQQSSNEHRTVKCLTFKISYYCTNRCCILLRIMLGTYHYYVVQSLFSRRRYVSQQLCSWHEPAEWKSRVGQQGQSQQSLKFKRAPSVVLWVMLQRILVYWYQCVGETHTFSEQTVVTT